MRILHMIPDIGISNGVMSVILNYFKAMPGDIQFDVLYFAHTEKTRQDDIEALGGRVYKVDPPSPKDLLSGKMNAFFDEHPGEWSALHIHCPHFAVFIAPYAKKHGIKKIAVHCHSTCYSLKGNQTRNKLLSLYAKYFIKMKFACSRQAGKLWYGNKEFKVLNNAIDCAAFAFNESKRKKIRKDMKLESAFVVGHIGRSDIPQKNHPFIITVFAQLKKKKSNARLLLMGADRTEILDQLCKALDIGDSVAFLGSRTDIPDLLKACDVFLFPSTNEGLPVSVVEAQASGLPVVMSDSVTDEVCITDNVFSLPLNASQKVWTDKLIEVSERSRTDMSDVIRKNGWDIYNNAEYVLSFYRKNL